MSFLLPDDDDDNPFANAVSPFASFTPPPPPTFDDPAPPTAAASQTVDYGSPLPTPSAEVVDHTPGPYVQAIEQQQQQSQLDPDASSAPYVADFASAAEPVVDARASSTSSLHTSAAPPPPAPGPALDDLAAPSSPDAFTGGFHTSPDRQAAFSIYRSSSPPPLERPSTPPDLSGFPTSSPPHAATASPARRQGKKEIEASLADLLGESEEVRLKGAFRKGAAASPARKTAGDGAKATPSKDSAAAASADDDDPFGALLRKRTKSAKPGGKAGAPAANLVAPVTAAPSSPPSAAAPAAASEDVKPESLPLPPSEPPTAPSTPRPPTPIAEDSSADLPDAIEEEVAPAPPPTTTATTSTTNTSSASPRVAVSPLVTPTPPAQISSSTSSSPSASPRQSLDGRPARFSPPRVERSFSELTLDGDRAAQLGLGGGADVDTGGGGWGAPLGGQDAGASWGGEEERLGLDQPEQVEEDDVDDDEAESDAPSSSAPAADPSQPVPVDKDFQAAAKKADRMFTVHISDPTKVGLGATAHIVYTVTTMLRVPTEYGSQAREVAVLRRFSDFLWLGGALADGNRGVVVPPVPDKQSFGRFGDEFIAHRRAQLQTFLAKTADHAVLQLDPVLTAFLTSDNWAGEMKHWARSRSGGTDGASGGGAPADKGYLASLASGLTGPKFVERDPWFEDRKAVLDTLEGQLRALVKSVELVSKQRHDLAAAMHDFAQSISALAQCDLSRPMSLALERFSDVLGRGKDKEDANGRADVGSFMATADEYIRLIGSVRNAFASRIKAYLSWQTLEADARRLATALDKARRQGKIAAERVGQEIALVADAERRAKEAGAEYESVTRLVKNEHARFEDERVADFKAMLEAYVEGMIRRQKALIAAYEEYQGSLVRLVQQSQPAPPAAAASSSPSRNGGNGPVADSSDGPNSPERARAAGDPFTATAEDNDGAGQSLSAGLPVENAWA